MSEFGLRSLFVLLLLLLLFDDHHDDLDLDAVGSGGRNIALQSSLCFPKVQRPILLQQRSDDVVASCGADFESVDVSDETGVDAAGADDDESYIDPVFFRLPPLQ